MQLDEYIERTCDSVPSLNCIVFTKYGEDIYRKSYGLANVDNNIKADIETSYGIGSITKIFTAIAVLKLVENNDIKLENEIYRYFNDSKLFNQLKKSNIKVCNLLGHTSGVCSLSLSESRYNPNYFLRGIEFNKNNIYDILNNVNLNKIDEPGNTFRYLNTGYILLGLILENIVKEKYETYIQNKILNTVDMTSTYFSNSNLNNKNIATPYITYSKKKHSIGTFLNSDFQQVGGIISNIIDLKKFIITLIDKGASNKIIKDSTFKKMCYPRKILKYNTSTYKAYSGLGLFINTNFYGDNLIYHNGGIMGGRANISLIPNKGVGAVVLSNSDNISAEEVTKMLLSNIIYKKNIQNKIEFDDIIKSILGKYTSYNNNTTVNIRKINKNLEIVFEYMPVNKKYLLFPIKYNNTFLTLLAKRKNEYFSKNIFKYYLKKNYFEFNQYLFFKTK